MNKNSGNDHQIPHYAELPGVEIDFENTQIDEHNCKFTDLFDIEEIQNIQDKFSSATGVASIITEVDGTPITRPSNFCRFCRDIVRKTEKGLKNCMLSDSVIGSPSKDGPRIQQCLSGGLIDGGVSIIVGDRHIANWLIGQVVDDNFDSRELLNYADQIEARRDTFEQALAEVKHMSKQQFTDICNYLYLTAQQLASLAAKNNQLNREVARRKKVEQQLNELNSQLLNKVLERTYQLEEMNSELEESNAMLEEEIYERQKAQNEIQKLNSELEEKIRERTYQLEDMNAELEESNALLEEENAARDEAEKALRDALSIQRATMDSIGEGILVVDNEGRVITYNMRFLQMWSIPGTLIEERQEKELIHFVRTQLKDPENFLNVLDQAYSNPESCIEDTLEFDDGKLYERYSKPLITGKEITGRIWSFRDITQQIQVEEVLKRAKAEAENANRAKSQFLANMSHEIRTPMNGIIGMTDLTLMTDLDEEQREYLTIVKSSTQSLLRVLNDILDYSKIEAGKVNLEIAVFDVRKTINEVVDLFAVAAKQKDIYLRLIIDSTIPSDIIGDSVRFKQVLSNIVGNAIKFTSKGGVTIRAVCEKTDKSSVYLKFIVSDTGIGISKQNMEKLFLRFSQIDDSNTKKYGGSGLGLAISKKLVEIMEGEIGVESEEGRGSDFFFTALFGLAEDENREALEEYTDHKNAELTNTDIKRLLLVEDDETSRKVALLFLKKKGFNVVVADNGSDAIRLFDPDKFDLVLMDINLPLLDGYSATAEIRRKEKDRNIHTPIIAMTAYALSGDEEKCIAAGMDDYISKPVDIKILDEKLELWLKDEPSAI